MTESGLVEKVTAIITEISYYKLHTKDENVAKELISLIRSQVVEEAVEAVEEETIKQIEIYINDRPGLIQNEWAAQSVRTDCINILNDAIKAIRGLM